MPFTPAHPAIVLPFINKRFFSATALIAGSISPDFEYFFKASVSSNHSHTLAGLFYFDLPVAIFLCFVFHLLIKDNLINNLPAFFQRRLVPVKSLDFKKYFSERYGVVIYSALIGSFSHLFWDSFTHNGAFFVNHLNVYQEVYVPFEGVKYPLFYALQHISTAVGLAVMGLYIIFLPADEFVKPANPKILYWFLLILLGAAFFALRFIIYSKDFNLGNAVVTGISAVLISLCILGFSRSDNYQKNIQV